MIMEKVQEISGKATSFCGNSVKMWYTINAVESCTFKFCKEERVL